MADPVLLVDKKDGYAVLTLNRPDKMNSLNGALRAALTKAVNEAEADPDIRVLVLTGAGERAFCAGLDLKEMGAGNSSVGDSVADDPVRALGKFSGPIVGAINGVAITGGFELALGCDVLVGCENTRFADTHARVGIMPGWGLSQKLSRLIGISRAKELSFTGNFIGAEQAERWGLINSVVPKDELVSVCEKLARDMLSVDADMLPVYKKLIDDGFAQSFDEGLKLETELAKKNASVSAEEVEARRKAVQERGKSQVS